VSIHVTPHPIAEWTHVKSRRRFLGTKLRVTRSAIEIALCTAVTRRLRTMGFRDKPTAPRSPIRRECADHIIVLGEAHLRCVLKSSGGEDASITE